MTTSGYVDMTIPPPSVLSNYVSDDSDYILDPDKVRDALPQPYRMVNKIVDFTFDIAWDEIVKREEERIAAGLLERPPKFECQVHIPVENAQVMTANADGKFTFIGTKNGIVIIDSISGVIEDRYEDETMVIIDISASSLEEGVDIISMIDVQGIARLFVFNGETVFLAQVINEGSGSIVNRIFTSKETDFIAVSMFNESAGEHWIDFHKVPKDTWVKEAATAKEKSPRHQPQKPAEDPVFSTETVDSENATPVAHEEDAAQPPAQAELNPPPQDTKSQPASFRFSNTSVILKVKAPGPSKASTAASPFNAFKLIDVNADVVSSGVNHILSSHQIECRENVFKSHRKELVHFAPEESPEKPIPHINFIAPTRFSPSGFDSGKPSGAVIWWENRNQISIYSLVKQAKDVNYKPDQVWPFPQRVTASAVSACAQLLAVGLANGTLIIWDLFSSLQRRVYSVSPGRAIIQVDFMNPSVCPQEQVFNPHLPYRTQTSGYVLVLSDDGQLTYCDTTMSPLTTPQAKSKQVLDAKFKHMEKFQLLPGIPNLILGIFNDGTVYILNALRGNYVCQIVTPDSHALTEDNIAIVAGEGQSIVCKAIDQSEEPTETQQPVDENPDDEHDTEETKCNSAVFLLQCLKFDVLEMSWSKSLPEVPFVLHTTLEKRLDALMQQRVSQQPIRLARLQQSWPNLGSTLEMLIKNKNEDKRPGSTESRYAASTIVGSEPPDTVSTKLKGL